MAIATTKESMTNCKVIGKVVIISEVTDEPVTHEVPRSPVMTPEPSVPTKSPSCSEIVRSSPSDAFAWL